jgi:hypothetical protein
MSLENSFIDCDSLWGRCSCRSDGAYMHPAKRDLSLKDEMAIQKEEGKDMKKSPI